MMCPMTYNTQYAATLSGDCAREKCAWWSASHAKCVVLVMATQMEVERVYRPHEKTEDETKGKTAFYLHEMFRALCKAVPDIGFPDYKFAVDAAIAALQAQEWIPVDERLPEFGQKVFIYTQSERPVSISVYYPLKPQRGTDWKGEDGGWYDCVTHWMPLPSPPLDRKEATANV